MAGMSDSALGRLLVAYDGSDNALRACESAASLARSLGTDVILLYVIPTLSVYTAPMAEEYYSLQQEKAEGLLSKGVAVFERRGVKTRSAVVRAQWSVVETIIRYADDEKCDLLVMGARGSGGFEKMLMGSVSSGVVAHAHCPVMIVR